MKFAYDIPDSFWSLFRSMNRELYMEALLKINEEYEYNNYYLSKEVCLQVLEDWNESQRIWLSPEEFESENDASQTPPNRILNWLIKTGWLKRIEDFSTLTTNIIIPDYAAVFLTAFEELVNPSTDDTEIYIQNVYATLFSFWHDKKMNLAMLKTALVNTKKLNKALQDMLHNMDHFFSRLLKQKSYEEVLAEHLEGYVEEIVEKKYHILKTNDNFYLYKNDIKRCLREMREDIPWMEQVQKKADKEKGEDVIFLRKIVKGGTDESYGIHVAKLAGVPKEVLKSANDILKGLERKSNIINKSGKTESTNKKIVSGQLDMYNYKLADIAHELDKINVNELTPIDALNILVKLKESAS